MTSLEADVAATQKVLDAQKGSTVLVGHSWGCVVIGEAGDIPRSRRSSMSAAFAPDKGETLQALTSGGPPTEGLKAVRPDGKGFLSIDPTAYAHVFVGDIPAAEGEAMAKKQRPIARRRFWRRSDGRRLA